MTSFRFRLEDTNPVHVRVGVFAGPDPDHRRKCGVLVMAPAEWEFLRRVLGPLPDAMSYSAKSDGERIEFSEIGRTASEAEAEESLDGPKLPTETKSWFMLENGGPVPVGSVSYPWYERPAGLTKQNSVECDGRRVYLRDWPELRTLVETSKRWPYGESRSRLAAWLGLRPRWINVPDMRGRMLASEAER